MSASGCSGGRTAVVRGARKVLGRLVEGGVTCKRVHAIRGGRIRRLSSVEELTAGPVRVKTATKIRLADTGQSLGHGHRVTRAIGDGREPNGTINSHRKFGFLAGGVVIAPQLLVIRALENTQVVTGRKSVGTGHLDERGATVARAKESVEAEIVHHSRPCDLPRFPRCKIAFTDRRVVPGLLQVRQEVVKQVGPFIAITEGDASGTRRQFTHCIVVIVQGEPELFQIALALHSRRCLSDFLDGGQQEADQDCDDGDHHQQLDERERPPMLVRALGEDTIHKPTPRKTSKGPQ